MLLLAILLLLPQEAGVGDVWLRTESGIIVSVDGVQVGTTTPLEEGLRLRNLPAGRHEISLRLPGAGATKFPVEVVFGQTIVLTIPALTLRTGGELARRGGLELRLDPFRPGCYARLRERRYQLDDLSTLIDDLSPGSLPITVTCSRTSLKASVQITTGEVTVVRADFNASRITGQGNRPRITRLVIPTTWDRLVAAPIPAGARRALIAAIRPGVELVALRTPSRSHVAVSFRATNPRDAWDLIERLRHSRDIREVQVKENVERGGRIELSLLLTVYPDDRAEPIR